LLRAGTKWAIYELALAAADMIAVPIMFFVALT
jgi:hypothetical protein